MPKIINYLSVFIVFSGALAFKGEAFGWNFDFFFYYVLVLLLLPIFLIFANFNTPKILWILVVVLAMTGAINIMLGNNSWVLLLKQIVGIGTMYLFFYYILKFNDFGYLKLFQIYIRIAKVVAVIALIQVIAYVLKIRPLYDFSYLLPEHRIDTTAGFLRVNSILVEPSHYVVAMAPAIFVSVYNLFFKTTAFLGKQMSWLIVLSVILTFSTVGYLCLAMSMVFLIKNPFSIRKVVVTTLFFGISTFIFYATVPTVTSRIDGLIELFIHHEVRRVNISSFTIFNNFTVAFNNFLEHPFFGSGLGSHQYVFDLYAYKDVYDPEVMAVSNALNKEDANSLFLRLLSETGLVGITAAFFFIARFRISDSHFHDITWIISKAILILIITKLLREGHYFNNGFPLFLWMYYYVKKSN